MPSWLQAWMAPYQDPMFWRFPMTGLAVSTLAFLAFALPYTALAWWDPVALRRYKVQAQPFEVALWFWPSLRQLGVNVMVVALAARAELAAAAARQHP